jgi:small subunit ribosomal protein S7
VARRRRAERRLVIPDPRFNSVELSRFINKVMLNGKKTTAQRIVYSALDNIEREAHRPGLELFELAVKNATPMLEVRSRRVGGATYQVPTEVRPSRRITLATAGSFAARAPGAAGPYQNAWPRSCWRPRAARAPP